LHAGAGGADVLDVGHAPGRLEDGVQQQRPGEAGPGLELGHQAVDVVDVLGALDLGDHDDVEPVADLGHRRGEVVERPRRVEAVHPGPQLGAAPPIPRPPGVEQPGPGGLLVVRPHPVLEVGQQDVDLRGHVRHLGHHLLVGGREEVDHPRRREGDLPHRVGRPDRKGTEEVLG
jgi:hypothetical protein